MSKNLLPALGFVCLLLSMLTIPTQAQYGTLPIGTFTAGSNSVTCPGTGWYNYNGQYVNCFPGTVSGCTGYNNVGAAVTLPPATLTFGYLDPKGIVQGVTQEQGVIVLLSGQDGTSPGGDPVGVPDGDWNFANYYFKQGYVIVELAWDSAWEATQNPFPITTPPTYGNIQLAACRPATFFNYVFNTIYLPIQQNYSLAGMCGHGFSAGSAAIAYSMAYYKPPATPPGWWWDNVELLAGPAVSGIKQGCKKPLAGDVTICGSGQWGCPNGTASWMGLPEFVGPAAGWVGGWTNDSTCANPSVNQTSSASELKWLQQSIVDDGTNNPVFAYPHTAMAGWLCRPPLGNQQTQSCDTDYHWSTCPNESSEQGQIFFNNFSQTNTPPVYNLYPVDSCNGPEGVAAGSVLIHTRNESGFDAVSQDMAGGPLAPLGAAQCVHPH